jgi:formate hydrogenlyase transcriptional activator
MLLRKPPNPMADCSVPWRKLKRPGPRARSGNIRELQNFIERSVILSTGAVLTGSFPELTGTANVSATATLDEAERSHILQTLERTDGVVGGRNGAAARLGLPRTTLIAKMNRLGINRGQGLPLPV